MSELVGAPNIRSNQKAFTVVESILFLALSAGMLFIALNAIRGRSDEVQFQQAMRSIESYVQLQQNNVLNGVVPDSSTITCNQSAINECIVLGRAIEFAPDVQTVRTHLISGSLFRDAPTNDEQSVTLYEANPFTDDPTLGSGYKELSDIDWEAEFVGGEMLIDGTLQKSADNRLVSYVRLPNGTEIVPVGFQSQVITADPVATAANAVATLNDRCLYGDDAACPPNVLSTIEDPFEARFCFRSADGDLFAQLVMGGQERRQAIKLEFLGATSCA